MKKHFISFDTFVSNDIRAGKVISAERLENSKKLLKLKVDLGEEYGLVQILTGMAMYFSPEELTGNIYLFVANLEPREMAGTTSQGMLLALDGPEKPVLLSLPSEVLPGTLLR